MDDKVKHAAYLTTNDQYPVLVLVCGRCDWDLTFERPAPSPSDPLALKDTICCGNCGFEASFEIHECDRP